MAQPRRRVSTHVCYLDKLVGVDGVVPVGVEVVLELRPRPEARKEGRVLACRERALRYVALALQGNRTVERW